jgi:hypothetical protein
MEENLTEEISKASEKKKVELQQMGTIGEIILEKRKGKLFSRGLINNRCSPLSDMGFVLDYEDTKDLE